MHKDAQIHPLGSGHPKRLFLLWVAGFALLLLGGCSRVSIAYRTADLLIEHYADDYLELENGQLANWRPMLRRALARHRREELPHLARFFDTAQQAAAEGFDPVGAACLTDRIEDIHRRHLHMAIGLVVPLLADLTPSQIDKLETKFEEEAVDAAKQDPSAETRRDHKRAERYADAMDWWLGPLSDAQHRIIEETTAAMPDTAVSWEAYRDAKRARLIALLRGGASAAELRAYLEAWLVELRDVPPDLRQAWSAMREQIVRLLVRMDASFSEGQRTHFAGRLASIRDDLMSLQRQPRMAPARCVSLP